MKREPSRGRERRGAIAVLACAVLGAAPGARAQGVVVALTPPDSVVASETEFDVRIEVTQAGSPFNGYEAVIVFDPMVFEFIQRPDQEGICMSGVCGNTFHYFVPPSGSDSLRVTDVLLCSSASVTGRCVLYTLRFRALSNITTSEIRFRRIEFSYAGIDIGEVSSADAIIRVESTTDAQGRTPLPSGVRLSASPNPFNPTSVIRVDVASSGRQRVVVNDVLGRHVRTLVDGVFEAGRRDVVWDGRDDRGARLASGVYLVSLEAHGESVTQRLVLVR